MDQPDGQDRAKSEGREHAGHAHRRRAPHAAGKQVPLEFNAHEKHVETHAELRADVENLQRVRWEELFLQSGEEEAEKGRPEEHARDHLADDLRLSDAPGECADNTADGQNDEHL
jgi:hypothetical protein